MTIRVFPVVGGARYSDDFSAEATASSRKHLGNDLLAPAGAPLVAVDSGQVHFGTDPLGGNIANVYADDGTRYYYAHLESFEGAAPRAVRAGEVIGYVGTTGNAAGGPSHVHFEVHPGNGGAVDPFRELVAAPAASAASASAAGLSPAGRLVVGAALGAVVLRAFAPSVFADLSRWIRS